MAELDMQSQNANEDKNRQERLDSYKKRRVEYAEEMERKDEYLKKWSRDHHEVSSQKEGEI